MNFIPYQQELHLDRVLEIYHSNCPTYFLEEELEEFKDWLKQTDRQPYWIFEQDNQIVGCGGIYLAEENPEAPVDVENEVGFAWGIIDCALHGNGLGKEMSLFRLNYLKENYPDRPVVLRTSQHTFAFYQKLGFEILEYIPKGFGDNLDKYILVYKK